MRIDPDTCDDPALLAAEVRRLRAVIAAADLRLTDAEREAVALMADIAADPRGVAVHHGCDVAATLRGMLVRMSGDGDCPAADNAAGQDNSGLRNGTEYGEK